MEKLFATIARDYVNFADDAKNSYGIPKFSYQAGENVLEVMRRVMRTDRFRELGRHSWIFLINDSPHGYILYSVTEFTVKALIQNLPEAKLNKELDFYFKQVASWDLARDLKEEHGIII